MQFEEDEFKDPEDSENSEFLPLDDEDVFLDDDLGLDADLVADDDTLADDAEDEDDEFDA